MYADCRQGFISRHSFPLLRSYTLYELLTRQFEDHQLQSSNIYFYGKGNMRLILSHSNNLLWYLLYGFKSIVKSINPHLSNSGKATGYYFMHQNSIMTSWPSWLRRATVNRKIVSSILTEVDQLFFFLIQVNFQ